MPGLGYKYSRSALSSPAEAGTPVRITSDLATASGITVSIESLVEGPGGDYTREQIDPTGTDLCVASELLFVVANPSGSIDDETTGAIDLVRGKGSGCDAPNPEPTEAPEPTQSPEPSETPTATTPTATPDKAVGPVGDYCTDMLQFQADVDGLMDDSELPVSAERVTEIFALADPYLRDLPDGGRSQIEILRSYADQASGQSASSAADVLAHEEFRRLGSGLAFLVQYCHDAQ